MIIKQEILETYQIKDQEEYERLKQLAESVLAKLVEPAVKYNPVYILSHLMVWTRCQLLFVLPEHYVRQKYISDMLAIGSGGCNEFAKIFRALVFSLGYKSRLVNFKTADRSAGHMCVEVRIDNYGTLDNFGINGWVLFDPTYVCVFMKGKRFLSLLDLYCNPEIMDIQSNKAFSNRTDDFFRQYLTENIAVIIKGRTTVRLGELGLKEFKRRFYDECIEPE